ncbi:cation-transporting P-type ATPase [Candidatus Saccharibacteria bacterium]|nr:cation-transporting P-type ATPase [Candidatus Saccharibacteria bacterium]MBR6122088.1 cation-transporting P-type ATPase [Candidatus Saccharibacteria bacterium]
MLYYNHSVKDSLIDQRSDAESGLSTKEVKRRRAKYGYNLLDIKTTPLWKKLIEPFADLFMIILVVALVLSILQQSWTEVIVIALDMVLDVSVFYIQRFSTERVLNALKEKTVQKITVVRNGNEEEVDASELVPGDVVILHEGDRIPADGRIISESGLLTNESMLTGESEAIAKDAKAISGKKKVYEQRNMVFSGSFVITGSSKFVVTATGNQTEYGRIASLATSTTLSSPIQEKINQLVVKIAAVILAVAAIILVVQLIDGISFYSAIEFTLAMIVSAVPEDLPIVTAIILAIGAVRLAKKQALIKELRAIQSIGIVTTIASDKTGTLTENKLSVKDCWSPEAKKTLKNNEDFLRTIASTAIPLDAATDPLDLAIWNHIKNEAPYLADLKPLKTYAFDQDLKTSGNLFEDKRGSLRLVIKGAPETIFAKCIKMTKSEKEAAETRLAQFSDRGYKVIAIASAKITHEINELSRLTKSDVFKFEGLIAIADSVRPGVIDAIEASATAGVKVKMVTGDHAQTAFAIGRELGLCTEFSEVLDCSKLGDLPDSDLEERVQNVSIFARVTPEDKFRILNAIKKSEVVAMTGDGVNDVPALTNAHVGIAMGNSPSIVQDAGDIVLLDNNFKSIVSAMKEGRVILANIRRMLIYLLATNAGEVLATLGALFISGSQLLLPIQILWINMVTDSLMVIPIGLEPPEAKFMSQKPEAKDAPILSKILVSRMIIIAVTMAAVGLGTYYLALAHFSHDEANTLAFTAIVVVQWSNAFCVRGTYESAFRRLKVKNTLFILALLLAITLQALVLFGPLSIFAKTVPVDPLALALTILAAFAVPILVTELHKKLAK